MKPRVFFLPACVACGSGAGDLDAVTDIRIHDPRSSIHGARSLPPTMEEVLRPVEPERRGEPRVDGYGNPIRYSVQGHRHELRSPGADRLPNTADDYVLTDSFPQH